jgi:serine/threonine protein kinase
MESNNSPTSPDSGLKRYQLKELIGEGGMGKVFRAHDPVLCRDVAIKILNLESSSDPDRERFKREARALATLSHPNIVAIYGSGVNEQGEPYHVMEFLDGVSLSDELKAGPLSAGMFLDLCTQVLSGLEHAHNNQIAHRDLKPSNIINCKDSAGNNLFKIIDFGIARVDAPGRQDGRTLTATNSLVGSPVYMSPEQCRGERGGYLSDIYAFGCVMFQCIAGRPPFQAETALETMYKHMSESPPSLPAKGKSQKSQQLADLIARCLAKAPESRPQSAASLLQEIGEIFRDGAGKIDLFSGRGRKRDLRPLAALAGVIILAGLALSLLFVFLHKRTSETNFVRLSEQEKISLEIEKLKARSYRDLNNLFALGRLQLKSQLDQDHRDAEKTYAQAIELCKPGSLLADRRVACLALKAKAEWLQGKYEASDRDFNQSLEVAKKQDQDVWIDILLERARFLVHVRRFDEALADLSTVISSYNFDAHSTFRQLMDNLDGFSQKLDKSGESRRIMFEKISEELKMAKPRSESETAAISRLSRKIAATMSDVDMKDNPLGGYSPKVRAVLKDQE